ncbi:LapA family protein [Pseudomonas syringae]|nr:LapA family protein [Pseudomonas syringae]MBD8574608.1 LapA family protein [Pseudomonas syringae]MBD8789170.1 LapA family protein [Pseudomonas syringae]MBD8800386.1 LapA family protein [Pseudomonas syringae]MBD8810598.1 LapA family protein [Pseudomonas syringae]
MRTFKKVISIVALLLMVAVVAVFVLENRQPVGLTFFGWTAPQLSLAVPVILALLLGMLIGPVLTWFAGLRKKRTVSTRSA